MLGISAETKRYVEEGKRLQAEIKASPSEPQRTNAIAKLEAHVSDLTSKLKHVRAVQSDVEVDYAQVQDTAKELRESVAAPVATRPVQT